MTAITVELSDSIARALLKDIAEENTGKSYASNKGWAWWAYDAHKEVGYPFGGGTVYVVQRPETPEWGNLQDEGDTEIVFQFAIDTSDEEIFFRVEGEYTSYNGDTWDEGTFKRVRPTAVVKRVFEVVE